MRWELALIGALALLAWLAIAAATIVGLADLVVPR